MVHGYGYPLNYTMILIVLASWAVGPSNADHEVAR